MKSSSKQVSGGRGSLMGPRVRSRVPGDLGRRRFHRILLIKPSSLGDVLHAVPVLHALRRRYPDAVVDWLVGSPYASLIEANPAVNSVIPFDRATYGTLGRNWPATRDFIGFLADLRRRAYDLVIDLQGLFRSGFLSWATGAGTRIGFANAREAASVFYSHRVHVSDPNLHAVERNFLVAERLDVEASPIEFRIPLPRAARTFASGVLAGAGRPIVAFAPGARWETKRWPAERFVQTIERVHARAGGTAVLLGGSDERRLVDSIAADCKVPTANLAGRTTIPELAGVVEQSDVVVCHDSAVAHLAVSLDRPLVCIVGPTNPRRTGPYQRPHDVVSAEVACSPCYLRRMTQCGYDHACMSRIPAAHVVDAVMSRLLPSGVEG